MILEETDSQSVFAVDLSVDVHNMYIQINVPTNIKEVRIPITLLNAH